MILLADRPLDHEFPIDATLAYALDMFSTRTTLKRLGQYVMDQVYPSRSYDYPGIKPEVSRFLAYVALSLVPPDDLRMSFDARANRAATEACPTDYADCARLVLSMGWGNLTLDVPNPSTRQACEAIEQLLHREARRLAMTLLNQWASNGHAKPI